MIQNLKDPEENNYTGEKYFFIMKMMNCISLNHIASQTLTICK